ncbi:MAG: hypothetical protein WEB53_16235 [Akkermansiaceae bacterium]
MSSSGKRVRKFFPDSHERRKIRRIPPQKVSGGFTVKRYNTRPAKPDEKGEEWVERGKVKVLESENPEFPEIIIKQPGEWVAWLDNA